MELFAHGANAQNAQRALLYYPDKRPGFVAWVTAFDYGNGDIGVSFKETLQKKNNSFVPLRLEMGEAVGAPVSYCSVECGSANEESYRVYLRSCDNGKTFEETGRCQLEQGSFCNAGFPDGRIIGFDVPRINEAGTGWCDYIDVRESTDGGHSWTRVTKLLEGTAPYLWRARRLRDGSIILLASLYGTPWGEGHSRITRNTMLPGESYLNKIQTFFLTTKDGNSFSGPHYVLPGIGAHEYDVAECANGDLLFIAGDVQATPVARQLVKKCGSSYVNGTLYTIRRGAPPAPEQNPQGGFVPETLVMLEGDVLVGSRRNKPYSCSCDYGENWFELDGIGISLYQPYMLLLPNGTVANFGHYGGDCAFGQEDMYVGADFFTLENKLPTSCTLSLSRNKSDDNTKFINGFTAVLQSAGKAVCDETVTFRFTAVWNADGSINAAKQEKAPIIKTAVTDKNGNAVVYAPEFDTIPDIHFYYNVDVIYRPTSKSAYRECDGAMMCVAALTPHRRCLYPYKAYFAEGTLYLSPELLAQCPNAIAQLQPCIGKQTMTQPLSAPLKSLLLEANVLKQNGETLMWYCSVHCKTALDNLSPMAQGDWYI